MKIIKITSWICIASCLLAACISGNKTYFQAHKSNSSIETQITASAVKYNFPNKNISNKNISNKRIVKKIGGSTDSGDVIFNKDKSLSCGLASWELVGVFDNNQLVTTQGKFIFEITNYDSESHDWVLFELLILDDEGNVEITSNPFRDLQGEILKVQPPIKSGNTRHLSRGWKYRNGWHNVTLKSCQWANSYEDYWNKYPELKDYLAP